MTRKLITLLTGAVLVLSLTACMSTEESSVFNRINDERAKVGQPPLIPDSELVAKAQAHSQEMATQGNLYHTTLRDGITGNPHRMGENVAYVVRSTRPSRRSSTPRRTTQTSSTAASTGWVSASSSAQTVESGSRWTSANADPLRRSAGRCHGLTTVSPTCPSRRASRSPTVSSGWPRTSRRACVHPRQGDDRRRRLRGGRPQPGRLAPLGREGLRRPAQPVPARPRDPAGRVRHRGSLRLRGRGLRAATPVLRAERAPAC